MAKLSLPKIKLDQEPSIRERIFFGAALVGLFLLFVNTFWTPTSEAMSRLRLEKKSLTIQAQAMEKLIQAARDQMARRPVKAEGVSKVDERVQKIIERRVVDMAEEINSTVDALGSRKVAKRVKVKKIGIGDRVDMPGYTVIPISLELQGPYTGVQTFMESVESIERPVVIQSFDMGLDKEKPGELNATLNVDLYIAKR